MHNTADSAQTKHHIDNGCSTEGSELFDIRRDRKTDGQGTAEVSAGPTTQGEKLSALVGASGILTLSVPVQHDMALLGKSPYPLRPI